MKMPHPFSRAMKIMHLFRRGDENRPQHYGLDSGEVNGVMLNVLPFNRVLTKWQRYGRFSSPLRKEGANCLCKGRYNCFSVIAIFGGLFGKLPKFRFGE